MRVKCLDFCFCFYLAFFRSLARSLALYLELKCAHIIQRCMSLCMFVCVRVCERVPLFVISFSMLAKTKEFMYISLRRHLFAKIQLFIQYWIHVAFPLKIFATKQTLLPASSTNFYGLPRLRLYFICHWQSSPTSSGAERRMNKQKQAIYYRIFIIIDLRRRWRCV